MRKTIILRDGAFERSTPEEQGIPSAAIAAFLNRLDQRAYNLHSVQIVRNQKLVYAAAAAPFTLNSPHRVFSAAKAINSLNVLFAIDEGFLRFEDPVINYFPDMLAGEPSDNLKRMTVYDLMTMQTGMETDPFPKTLFNNGLDLTRLFFETPVEEKPGTRFKYNNSVPHVLYALVERAAGRRIEEYQSEHLCKPLGAHITAQYNALGIYNPVTTVLSNNDLLRFGLFYLQEGAWEGKQLLSPGLVRYATSYHVPTHAAGGSWGEDSAYGMQVMRNSYGGYRLPGGFGQFAIVLPQEDMVVSLMAAQEDMEPPLDAFREEILAHLQRKPLPADRAGAEALALATGAFNLAPRSPGSFSGAAFPLGKELAFEPNAYGLEHIRVQAGRNGIVLAIRQNGLDSKLRCGRNGAWVNNGSHLLLPAEPTITTAIFTVDPQSACLSGAWESETALIVKQQSLAEMVQSLYRFSFEDGKLVISYSGKPAMGRASLKDPDLLAIAGEETHA